MINKLFDKKDKLGFMIISSKTNYRVNFAQYLTQLEDIKTKT